MDGRAKARQGALEQAVLAAWYGERFAREKKLKRLGIYLAELRPRRAQSGEEILAIMQGFAAAGVPMKIRKIKKG